MIFLLHSQSFLVYLKNVYCYNRGICETGRDVAARIETLVPSLAKAYLELYKSAMDIREFFGLRDFYRWVMFNHV